MFATNPTPARLEISKIIFKNSKKCNYIKKKRQRDAAVAGYAAIYSGAVSYMSVIKNEYPSCSAS